MKTWEAGHPKAKLMARKRADILAAAKRSFLEAGYEGTSMEGIARTADVSIMTLYRHAESKDDLFAAVIAKFCDPSSEEERAAIEALMRKPLPELLMEAGVIAQQRLLNPDTVALMRTVMAEATRFPHLAELAYASLIGRLEEMAADMLGQKQEAAKIAPGDRRHIAAHYVDALIGADMLRALMGLPGLKLKEQKARAKRAADEVMAWFNNERKVPRF